MVASINISIPEYKKLSIEKKSETAREPRLPILQVKKEQEGEVEVAKNEIVKECELPLIKKYTPQISMGMSVINE